MQNVRTIVLIALLSVALNADLLKVNMGAGIWQHTTSGSITSTLNQTLYFKDNLSTHENTQNSYVYIDIKHTMPIVPNLRFEYVNLSTTSTNTELGAKSRFVPMNLSVTTNTVNSSLQIQQYDTIFFYTPLEYEVLTIDVGLDMKYLLTDYELDSIARSSEQSVIPLVYVRGRVEIPETDIGIETDVKYITDGSSMVYDLSIKVNYTMTFIPVVHPGIELGYRVEQFTSTGDDSALIGPILSSKTDSDIGFSGFYGGLTVSF